MNANFLKLSGDVIKKVKNTPFFSSIWLNEVKASGGCHRSLLNSELLEASSKKIWMQIHQGEFDNGFLCLVVV